MVKSLYARKHDRRIILCHFNFNPVFEGKALFEELKRRGFSEEWEGEAFSIRLQCIWTFGNILGSLRTIRFYVLPAFRQNTLIGQRLLTRTIPYAIIWAPNVGDEDWFKKLDEEGYIGKRVLLYTEQMEKYYASATHRVKYPSEGLIVRFPSESLANLVGSAIL